jgi:hypothetical protein
MVGRRNASFSAECGRRIRIASGQTRTTGFRDAPEILTAVKDLGMRSLPPGGPLSFSTSALAPIWQLNARFLEALVACSRRREWIGSTWEAALGSGFADTPPGTLSELSRCPVSLLDAALKDFASVGFHKALAGGSVREPPPFLQRRLAIELAQLTLTLAWTLSRSDPVAASVIFGLPQPQAGGLARLAVQAIPAIAERLAGELRPRWIGEPRIWSRLLGNAQRSSSSRFAPLCVRVLQRQFSDLVLATFATRPTHDLRR